MPIKCLIPWIRRPILDQIIRMLSFRENWQQDLQINFHPCLGVAQAGRDVFQIRDYVRVKSNSIAKYFRLKHFQCDGMTNMVETLTAVNIIQPTTFHSVSPLYALRRWSVMSLLIWVNGKKGSAAAHVACQIKKKTARQRKDGESWQRKRPLLRQITWK